MSKTRADLFEAFAKVVRICEDTPMPAYQGVKYEGGVVSNDVRFDSKPEDYTFAIGIVEERFLFEGNMLYQKANSISVHVYDGILLSALTWTRPEVKPTQRELHIEAMRTAIAGGKTVEYLRGGEWRRLRVVESVKDDDYEYRITPVPEPTPRELHIAAMKAAFERGEVIEYLDLAGFWWALKDCESIENDKYEYRIKPEVKQGIVRGKNVMSQADDILSRPHAFRLADFYDLCKELEAEVARLNAAIKINSRVTIAREQYIQQLLARPTLSTV